MIKKIAVIGMMLSLAGAMVGCGDTPASQQTGNVIYATTETATQEPTEATEAIEATTATENLEEQIREARNECIDLVYQIGIDVFNSLTEGEYSVSTYSATDIIELADDYSYISVDCDPQRYGLLNLSDGKNICGVIYGVLGAMNDTLELPDSFDEELFSTMSENIDYERHEYFPDDAMPVEVRYNFTANDGFQVLYVFE